PEDLLLGGRPGLAAGPPGVHERAPEHGDDLTGEMTPARGTRRGRAPEPNPHPDPTSDPTASDPTPNSIPNPTSLHTEPTIEPADPRPGPTAVRAGLRAGTYEGAGLQAFLNQLPVGLSIAAVLLLIALGLTFTFGQMGVINMAHGEFI